MYLRIRDGFYGIILLVGVPISGEGIRLHLRIIKRGKKNLLAVGGPPEGVVTGIHFLYKMYVR